MRGVKPFYCNECRKFLPRRKVQFRNKTYIPYYRCKQCGSPVYVTEYILDNIIKPYIKDFEAKNGKPKSY